MLIVIVKRGLLLEIVLQIFEIKIIYIFIIVILLILDLGNGE